MVFVETLTKSPCVSVNPSQIAPAGDSLYLNHGGKWSFPKWDINRNGIGSSCRSWKNRPGHTPVNGKETGYLAPIDNANIPDNPAVRIGNKGNGRISSCRNGSCSTGNQHGCTWCRKKAMGNYISFPIANKSVANN
jgi:hypothetical protein